MCLVASSHDSDEGRDRQVMREAGASEPLDLLQSLEFFTAAGTTGESALPAASLGSVRVAEEWRRLTAVDALDRWLHAPVDSSLVDAERGLARVAVARQLDEGSSRELVFEDALGLTRGACYGLENYFRQLAGPVPDRLVAGLRHIVESCETLAERVPEADDLRASVDAGRRALDVVAAKRPRRAPGGRRTPTGCGRRSGLTWTSAIDPRQVPARVLELSDDPNGGEVLARRTGINGVAVLDVEVPAFHAFTETSVHWNVRGRLIARFVDRATGDVRARQVLTIEPRATATDKRYVFRTRCPLEGLDPGRLRVDIADAAIDLPPVRHDADPDLVHARHAMLALREARSAAAMCALGVTARGGCAERGPAALHIVAAGSARPLVAELALAHELALVPGS